MQITSSVNHLHSIYWSASGLVDGGYDEGLSLHIGELIGLKTIVNELVAFEKLGELVKTREYNLQVASSITSINFCVLVSPHFT